MPLFMLVLAFLSCYLYTLLKLKFPIHILQLNSYRNRRYLRWLSGKWLVAFTLEDLLPLVAIVPLLMGQIFISLFLFVLLYAVAIAVWFWRLRMPAKKPLHFTFRVIRLYIFSGLVLLFLNTFLFGAVLVNGGHLPYVIAGLVLLNFLLPFFLLLCNFVMKPVEKFVNSCYLYDAKKILASMSNLKIIGITGSYGKTSTKHIVYEILRNKFTSIMTPGSYNTPMGICKVIRSDLRNNHEVFVVEMSAKEVHDIKEICDFVKPQFGILTSVGPQHLETFKTIENVKKTKNELIEALPKDGVAVFNMDNNFCRDLSKQAKVDTVIGYGLDNSNKDLDYFATDVKISGLGSSFTLHTREGESEKFTTRLLGEHNISNILAAIALTHEMGVSLKEMVYPIKKLPPIEHRLELRPGENSMIIIDDAFNSNPVGSSKALEVLDKIEGNKKIIITPGMIELGEEQDALNKEFGKKMAKVCDYVILVGKRQTVPIQEGLKEVGFNDKKLYVATSFNDGYSFLQTISEAHDVVLLENDLPDDYNEG